MSSHKTIVERYVEGVRRGDQELVLSCVTDDVAFEIHGVASARGKNELKGFMNNDAFQGPPAHTIDRLIEEGDSVVVSGRGGVALTAGGRLEFVFCDIFTFTGDVISRVESYQVNQG